MKREKLLSESRRKEIADLAEGVDRHLDAMGAPSIGRTLAQSRVRLLRGYDPVAVADATAVDCTGDKCIVQQGFAEDCDVNVIMRRFAGLGAMPAPRVDAGVYGDFTGIHDLESAVKAVERAQAGFMTLAPEVRERFRNDPVEFARFVSSAPDDEVVALGVTVAPAVPAEPAPVVAAVPPAEAPKV